MAGIHPLVQAKTGLDLGAQFGSIAGKGIYISFQWEMVALKSVDPTKNGTRQRRLKIIKQPVGDPSSSAVSYISPEVAARLYPAEWAYFNQNGDMPLQGTALSELPGISQSQIQLMQLSGLRSIEDVLMVDSSKINRIGHEGRFVRNVAEQWDARRKSAEPMLDYAQMAASHDAALLAERRRADHSEVELSNLRAELAALKSLMNGGASPTLPPGASIGAAPSGEVMVGSALPALEDTENPLADGDGEIDDDPLNT